MVGGYIIDRFGIITNFSITCAVQLVFSTLPLLFIAKYVPNEKDTTSISALRNDLHMATLKLQEYIWNSMVLIDHSPSSCEKEAKTEHIPSV